MIASGCMVSRHRHDRFATPITVAVRRSRVVLQFACLQASDRRLACGYPLADVLPVAIGRTFEQRRPSDCGHASAWLHHLLSERGEALSPPLSGVGTALGRDRVSEQEPMTAHLPSYHVSEPRHHGLTGYSHTHIPASPRTFRTARGTRSARISELQFVFAYGVVSSCSNRARRMRPPQRQSGAPSCTVVQWSAPEFTPARRAASGPARQRNIGPQQPASKNASPNTGSPAAKFLTLASSRSSANLVDVCRYPRAKSASRERLIADHGLIGQVSTSACRSAVLLVHADPDAVKGACVSTACVARHSFEIARRTLALDVRHVGDFSEPVDGVTRDRVWTARTHSRGGVNQHARNPQRLAAMSGAAASAALEITSKRKQHGHRSLAAGCRVIGPRETLHHPSPIGRAA